MEYCKTLNMEGPGYMGDHAHVLLTQRNETQKNLYCVIPFIESAKTDQSNRDHPRQNGPYRLEGG